MTDTKLMTIKVVNDRLRDLGQRPGNMKPSTFQIREALEADKTISVAIPEGMKPADVQRNMLKHLRTWAKSKGWRIRIRTAPEGDTLIVWREPLTAPAQ
jgi:hypothetical protein